VVQCVHVSLSKTLDPELLPVSVATVYDRLFGLKRQLNVM